VAGCGGSPSSFGCRFVTKEMTNGGRNREPTEEGFGTLLTGEFSRAWRFAVQSDFCTAVPLRCGAVWPTKREAVQTASATTSTTQANRAPFAAQPKRRRCDHKDM
jgi:hypothetical protein